MIDSLTGLSNRVETLHKINQLFSKENVDPITLVLLDIGRFRHVNDSVGIHIGDRIIRIVSKRIKNAAPEAHIVGRTSGDNFTLAFKGLNEAELKSIVDRLLDLIQRPIAVGGSIIIVSLSLGIATSNLEDNKDAASLFHFAGIALHYAQNNEIEVAFFEASMLDAAKAAHALENDLRVAIVTQTPELHSAIATQQFAIHYQPIISGIDYSIAGFEALIRWHHPERGWVSPGKFIPIAEEIGVIDILGSWVMRKASQSVMQWQGPLLKKDFFLSVNVSAKQFQQPSLLVNTIQEALQTSNLPAHRLKLELTETATINETPEKFLQVKQTGCQLSLDDFGTGYSSLTYLHSLPFDSVKLDRSFISDLYVKNKEKWPVSEQMVRAIFSLSKAIGIDLIIEGVETSTQLNFLRQLGFPMYQGYLFSKPIPEEQVPHFLSNTLTWRIFNERSAIQPCILEQEPCQRR